MREMARRTSSALSSTLRGGGITSFSFPASQDRSLKVVRYGEYRWKVALTDRDVREQHARWTVAHVERIRAHRKSDRDVQRHLAVRVDRCSGDDLRVLR